MNPSGFYGAVYDTAKGLGATDVQANLAAAQASNETGYGASVFGNNYFGIKASSTYTGPSAYADTTEEVNGVRTPTTGNFRVYDDMTQSVADYMGMMQKNFPDAWNASTVKEAVKNLDNGVYGKYATLSSYTSDISKIANKYGPVAEANSFDASSIPTPEARPTATLNGFSDLASTPTPTYPDLQQNGILSAMFTSNPTPPVDATPSGILGTQNLDASAKVGPSLLSNSGWQTMANPGTPLDNSGWQAMAAPGPMGGYPADPMERMAPSSGPVAYGTTDVGSGTGIPSTVADRMGISVPSVPANDWSTMAAAGPVQAPVNAPVAATGLMSSPITGNLGTVSQQGLLNGTINALNASQQQALSTPMLSQAMNPSYPALAAPVDTGLLSANSPFATPAVNPAYDAAISNLAASQAQPTATGLLSQPNMSPSTLGTVAQYGPLNYAANALNAANQQAISTPMLQQAMSPSYPSLSQPVDTGTLSANSPFATPAIDPSVNAAVNNVASSYSAAAPTTDRFATAPSTFDASRFGVPDITAAMNQSIANSVAATPQMPSVSSIAPTSTGLLSSYQSTPATTSGQTAITGILSSPTTSASSVAPFMDAPVKGPFDTAVTNAFNAFTPAKVMDTPLFGGVVNPSVPSLETGDYNLGVSTPGYQKVVDLSFPASIPSIAAANSLPSTSTTDDTSVPGPATTPATTQQAISSGNLGVGTTAAPSRFGGLINKGTLIGGLLGSAVAGPVGGLLGGLLGNKVNQGGLAGLLGSSHPMDITNVGGGMNTLGSIWGGGMAPGSQGTANNGDRVTSLGNGWTAVTNQYGVTTTFGPNQLTASYFGPALTPTSHTSNSGPSGSPTGVGGAAY